PYVVTEHTRVTNNFRSALHRRLTLLGFRHARAIIAVSRWHADEIGSYTQRKPVVVPNVIRFQEIPERVAHPDTEEFQIGFLGGLHTPVKGLGILLQAAAGLAGPFKLHIGGSGTLLDRYKEQAKELGIDHKCIFYGWVPYTEVKTFMSRLHIFV